MNINEDFLAGPPEDNQGNLTDDDTKDPTGNPNTPIEPIFSAEETKQITKMNEKEEMVKRMMESRKKFWIRIKKQFTI